MKNLSLTLNIVLLIAVAVLYYFHFKLPSESGETLKTSSSGANILFINSDSLIDEYAYSLNEKNELESSQNKMKSELNSESDKLKKEVKDYQDHAAGMTDAQRQQIEESLAMKQQELMNRKDELMGKLDEQQNKSSDELYSRVEDFLRKFTKEKNVQFIFGHQKGGGILYANDSLNITHQVIEGLNKEYSVENK